MVPGGTGCGDGADTGWQRLLKGLKPLSWQSRLPWPPPGEPGASPFPGLKTFERRHAAVFFGQDQVLRALQETINQLPQRQSRLLVILGASGCRKSSLLRAGLVPWLAEADKGRWIVLEPFRPEEAEDPTPALAAVLRQAYRALDLPPPDEDATTAEALHRQLRQLRLQSNQQDARVVIPIDQFEEVLGRGNERNPKAAAAADAFLALLAELLAMKASQVLIIATLRSDFFGQLQQLHPSGLHGWAGDPCRPGETRKWAAWVEAAARRRVYPRTPEVPRRLPALHRPGRRLHQQRSAPLLSPPPRLPSWCYRCAEAWRLEPLGPLPWGCWFCPG